MIRFTQKPETSPTAETAPKKVAAKVQDAVQLSLDPDAPEAEEPTGKPGKRRSSFKSK